MPQRILIVFVSGKSNLKLYVVCEMIGSNFVAGSGLPHMAACSGVPCLAHSLQCVINDGVLEQKGVQDLLPEIVGHYKHLNVAFDLLQRIQA